MCFVNDVFLNCRGCFEKVKYFLSSMSLSYRRVLDAVSNENTYIKSVFFPKTKDQLPKLDFDCLLP